MILYLDTSALVKLYADEAGSDIVRQAVAESDLIVTSRGIADCNTASASRAMRMLTPVAEALADGRRSFARREG